MQAYQHAAGTRAERSCAALAHMGIPIVNGGISTFVGIAMLAFAEVGSPPSPVAYDCALTSLLSQFGFIVKYFFGVFVTVVAVGLFNGLVLLPVLLTWVGPSTIAEFTMSGDSEDSSGKPHDSHGGQDYLVDVTSVGEFTPASPRVASPTSNGAPDQSCGSDVRPLVTAVEATDTSARSIAEASQDSNEDTARTDLLRGGATPDSDADAQVSDVSPLALDEGSVGDQGVPHTGGMRAAEAEHDTVAARDGSPVSPVLPGDVGVDSDDATNATDTANANDTASADNRGDV